MRKSDINNQSYIYFYSPLGTWTRIIDNLKYLGLNHNKKIASTQTRDFIKHVINDTYMDIYNDYDVIYLDEFYDCEFHDEITFEICFNAMEELINDKKQIVMAGHFKWNNIKMMPNKLRKNTTIYDLNYNIESKYTTEYIK